MTLLSKVMESHIKKQAKKGILWWSGAKESKFSLLRVGEIKSCKPHVMARFNNKKAKKTGGGLLLAQLKESRDR